MATQAAVQRAQTLAERHHTVGHGVARTHTMASMFGDGSIAWRTRRRSTCARGSNDTLMQEPRQLSTHLINDTVRQELDFAARHALCSCRWGRAVAATARVRYRRLVKLCRGAELSARVLSRGRAGAGRKDTLPPPPNFTPSRMPHRCTARAAGSGTGCTRRRRRTRAPPARAPRTPAVEPGLSSRGRVLDCTVPSVTVVVLTQVLTQEAWLAQGTGSSHHRAGVAVSGTAAAAAAACFQHSTCLHCQVVADVLHRAVLAHALQGVGCRYVGNQQGSGNGRQASSTRAGPVVQGTGQAARAARGGAAAEGCLAGTTGAAESGAAKD